MDKYNEKIINAVKCCTHRQGTTNCGKCGYSCYQNCIDTMLSDLEAAIRRPLQKPLTLEEACGSNEPCVYLEMRNDRMGFRGYRAAYSGLHATYVNLYERKENEIVYRALILDIGTLFFSGKDYGVTWRCWATKPTQAEREAAKWDD